MVQKKASFSNKDESVNISFIQHKSVRIGLNNIYYSSKCLIEKNKQNPKPFPNQWTPKKEKKKICCVAIFASVCFPVSGQNMTAKVK